MESAASLHFTSISTHLRSNSNKPITTSFSFPLISFRLSSRMQQVHVSLPKKQRTLTFVRASSNGETVNSDFQVKWILQPVTNIVRGSGRVQVVGVDGKRVLETHVKGGYLFIVLGFFVVSKIADADGMEWFSIITTPNPIFSHLAGRTSVWKAMSPEILEAAFNTTPETEKLFRIMVGLPSTENRELILKKLLAKEKVEEDLDYKELATMTEGFSGSDLKNLCTTAAYRPVRELIRKERLKELVDNPMSIIL